MDLNEPLGMKPPPARRGGGLALVAVLVATAIGGLSFVLATADPHGGEPYAVSSILPRKTSAAPSLSPSSIDPQQTGSLPSSRDEPAKDVSVVENGVRVRSASSQVVSTAPEPLVIDVSRALDHPFGKGVHGTLGAPAASSVTVPAAAAQPRIAIYVSGMGLSQAATTKALESMPAAVAFAFVPYGAAIGSTVAAAKAGGHEVLLQIPMQNATGGPPGPHALRPGESTAALDADIAWLTSRFDGYDGVTNLLGAPVTADTQVMTALMRAVGARKVFYLGDATSRRDVAPGLAPSLGIPLLQADLVLDATAEDTAVADNLERLLAIARRKGSAIGMATGLPDHMEAIARFARDTDSKGVALVPISALVGDAGKPAVTAVTR